MNQLLSRDDVLKITSLSRATLFRKERSGEFPNAVRISAGRVASDSEAVDEWVKEIVSAGPVT